MDSKLWPEYKSILATITCDEVKDGNLADVLLEKSISSLSFLDCLLSYFVSVNFIGGFGEETVEIGALDEEAVNALSCEGEVPFKQTTSLGVLWICKCLSHQMSEVSRTLRFSYLLFFLKCVYLNQYLLGQERSTHLDAEVVETLKECEAELEQENKIVDSELICYYILAAYLSVFYYRYEVAEDFANRCAAHLNLSINFTGALGKRTRFQQSDVANLLLKVDRPSDSSETSKMECSALPKIVSLNDDTLLNSVLFTGDESKHFPVLSVYEQSLILLLCELFRLAHPVDDLTSEQRLAYLNAIVRQAYPDPNDQSNRSEAQGSSWPVATETLFQKSIIERNSARKSERSLSQLEELANQFGRKEPPLSQRHVDHFFLTRMPSVWTVQIEQARLLVRAGCYKSALDVFLRWNRWFDIIDCYTHLNKRELAEEVIRQQLAKGDKSPELYCALGDVTENRDHYLKAWEISNHKSARAMRSLAVVYMYADRDYAKAIECFEKSLAINNLQNSVWFTFGCCCLQAKEYAKAENAFRRCVQIEPENFEAWNNCASAVVLQGKKDIALKLLKEACRYNYENWRIWDNISIISADVGSFQDTIQACHRLLDLRGKYSDAQVLGVLAKAVLDDVKDCNGMPASTLRSKVLELFGRVTASTPTNATIWDEYAHLLLGEKPKLQLVTYQKAVQDLQIAHRCRIQPSAVAWENDPLKRKAVVRGLHVWAETVFRADDLVQLENGEDSTDIHRAEHDTFIKSMLASLRLSLKSVIGRLKKAEECCIVIEVREEVNTMLSDLNELENVIEKKLEN
ncbi:unnamed protein product [Calicophoron daubneyi]|uniref:Tetratricopeptide repeat protein 27 n=1 Tax=Calicophoron daubneyi TaxID=300641 RepID=A0AAV2TDA6_CALDB